MSLLALEMWQGGGFGGLGGFVLPLLLMFGIMYFLVIYGTINGIDGDTFILKVADNVKIRIARAAIAQVETPEDGK